MDDLDIIHPGSKIKLRIEIEKTTKGQNNDLITYEYDNYAEIQRMENS
jgi:hypothetical protein